MAKKLCALLLLFCLVFSVSSCSLLDRGPQLKFSSHDEGLGLRLFKGTSRQLELIIPDDEDGRPIVAIDDFAVANAEYLEVIKIGPNVKSIAPWAFTNCQKLSGIYVDKANKYYTDLDGVLFTKDMKTLLAYPNMKAEDYSVPSGVEIIAQNAFYKCGNLKSLKLPDSLLEIEDRGLMRCSSLKNLNIPDKTQKLGMDALSFCSSLRSIFLPASITEIGDFALWGCTGLEEIQIEADSTDGIELGKNWRPVKADAVNEKIPLAFSKNRESGVES